MGGLVDHFATLVLGVQVQPVIPLCSPICRECREWNRGLRMVVKVVERMKSECP